MGTRIGINGFGRMGRLALRAGWASATWSSSTSTKSPGGPATAAHLLMFDSVHGRWDRRVERGRELGDRRRRDRSLFS